MLTNAEKEFILYWENKRKNKTGAYIFFIKGVRTATIFISLIMLSLVSGWYKRVAFLTTGMMVTVFVGMFLLVLFMAFFTYQYNFENNEQRYYELLQKRDKS